MPLLLNSYILSGWVSGSHKYNLSSDETWMLKKPRKSFMQPMTVCLPWLSSYRCHTQPYARLWKYLSSYSKLVHLCVWILFVCYQKVKVACGVVFRDEGTFEPTRERLIRESRTNPLTWEVIWVYPPRQCFLRLSLNTFILDHLAFS
jgi:hypothetical protein